MFHSKNKYTQEAPQIPSERFLLNKAASLPWEHPRHSEGAGSAPPVQPFSISQPKSDAWRALSGVCPPFTRPLHFVWEAGQNQEAP